MSRMLDHITDERLGRDPADREDALDAEIEARAAHLAMSRSDQDWLDDLCDVIHDQCQVSGTQRPTGVTSWDAAIARQRAARADRRRALRAVIESRDDLALGRMLRHWLADHYVRRIEEDAA